LHESYLDRNGENNDEEEKGCRVLKVVGLLFWLVLPPNPQNGGTFVDIEFSVISIFLFSFHFEKN
jgi:hypothetical protein